MVDIFKALSDGNAFLLKEVFNFFNLELPITNFAFYRILNVSKIIIK